MCVHTDASIAIGREGVKAGSADWLESSPYGSGLIARSGSGPGTNAASRQGLKIVVVLVVVIEPVVIVFLTEADVLPIIFKLVVLIPILGQ